MGKMNVRNGIATTIPEAVALLNELEQMVNKEDEKASASTYEGYAFSGEKEWVDCRIFDTFDEAQKVASEYLVDCCAESYTIYGVVPIGEVVLAPQVKIF